MRPLLSILVVDDQTLMRQILRAALANHPNMRVVGEAGTGQAALAEARRLHPDVVVLDLGLPDIDGVEVTRLLRAEMPFTAIVILTASERDDQLVEALRAGAKGYVLKTSDFKELVSALESVAIGQASLPPEVVGKLLGQLPAEAAATAVAVAPVKRVPGLRVDLSERELDVLRLVVTGTRNREIAHRLALSENTVRSYLTHIMQKLGVENRVQVATEAVRRGLVSLDEIAL